MEIFFTILIMTLVVSLSGVVTARTALSGSTSTDANRHWRASGVADLWFAR